MKLIHFADLHLGIESYGTVDPETGLSTRLADVLRVLDELVDFSIEEQADAVIFCGDAYKTRDPSQTQQRELAKRVKRLADGGIPTFLLVGNHDLPNAPGRANALEIFQTLSVSNVFVAAKPDVQVIQTRSGPLQVASLPWLRKAGLLSKADGRALTIDEIVVRLQEGLASTVSRLADRIDRSMPSVLAAHVSVASAKVGSERTMMLGKEPVILASNIALPQFDYVALGHIHKQQILYERPIMAYSGSLERVDFGEEQDEKGFFVVDIRGQKDRRVSAMFRPVKARRFVTVRAKLDASVVDPTGAVIAELSRGDYSEAIVRVEIECPQTIERQLREADVRQALVSAYSVNISKNVDRDARIPRLGQDAAELGPKKALELYLESMDASKVSEEQKKRLLEYGERLIWERETAG